MRDKCLFIFATAEIIGRYDCCGIEWDESGLGSAAIMNTGTGEKDMCIDCLRTANGREYMSGDGGDRHDPTGGFFPSAPIVRAKTAIKKRECTDLILRPGQQTEIADYLLSLNNDTCMVATWIGESGLNPWALGSAGEKGMCQLMPNSTNNIRITDPRRDEADRRWQAQKCVDKRLASSNKNIWTQYKYRFNYMK